MSGPPSAHTASSNSASASSSGGVNPGRMVPETYLYNPNLAIANWVNHPPTYTQAGGTSIAWSQPQTLQNPLQSQEPPLTTQLHANAPSTSHPPEYLPLEERPILQVPDRLKRGNPDAQQDDRAKRARYYESEDSEEDEPDKALAEEFDPESYYHANRKLKLSESVQKYVDTHFRSCLSREVRRAMARDNPLPDTPSLHPPETDDVLVDYMGNDFPSSSEEHYKRIQTAVISAGAPMLNLWAHLEEQQLTVGQGGLVQTEVVLEMIQKSLVLLGNTSNYVSEIRRDLIIGKLSKKKRSLGRVLKSACKKNKPEGALLFGPAVYKAISERVDTLAAFNKTAGKAQGAKPDGKFFRGGPAFRDSGKSGKFPKPFHSSGQRIYVPPEPQYRRRPEFRQFQPTKKPFKKACLQYPNPQQYSNPQQ